MKTEIYIAVIFYLFVVLFFQIEINAQTNRYVSIGGDNQNENNLCSSRLNPCRTITHAINVASTNDIIIIGLGIYTETLLIDKSLSLSGADAETTIIQAHEEPGVAVNRVITVTGEKTVVEITEITIRNGKAFNGGGIYNDGATISLKNITLRDNSASQGGGMYNINTSPTLIQVIFEGNSASLVGGGMYNTNNSSPSLEHVIFAGNSARLGGGIYNNQSSPSLSDVTFNGNIAVAATGLRRGGGMYNTDSSPNLNRVTFNANEAHEGGGMYNFDKSDPTLIDVIFFENIAEENGGGMANNEYSSPVLRNVNFERNKAKNGGGVHNNKSNPTFVDVDFSENAAAPVNHLTKGGGMYNGNNSSPILTNVTLNSNNARLGGGMYNDNNSFPILTQVVFEFNNALSSGGGMYSYNNSSPKLKNVKFYHNVASYQGGGMLNELFSSPTLINVEFRGNWCYVDEGYTMGGGMSNLDNSHPSLVSVVFKYNHSSWGAAIYNNNSSPTFTNVTIANNEADQYGGGMYNVNGSSPILSNAIIWDNKTYGNCDSCPGSVFNADESSQPLIKYSLVDQSGGSGPEWNSSIGIDNGNNIYTDPLFIGTSDFRLAFGSPAIDAGDPEIDISLFATNSNDEPVDLDGNPRLRQVRIDMGAYEFQGLDVPHLVSPDNAAEVLDIPVTLSWEQVEGADTYRVQVSSGDSLFNNVLIDEAVGEVEFQLLDLDQATQYHWRARSENAEKYSEWSEVRSFTTESITSVKVPSGIPSEYLLHQNYPNPFNPSTTIRYNLPDAYHVLLEVYNMLGQRVAVLVDESQQAGYYTVQFNAESLPSGVYLYRITAGENTVARKLLLLR